MNRCRPIVTLNEAFINWQSGQGIFSEFVDPPWEEDVSATLLDMDYFGNHSGWKKCSPLLYNLFDYDNTLSAVSRGKIAELITAKYYPNWIALWRTYHFEYDPLSSTDITEVGTKQTMDSKTALEVNERQRTAERTDNKTESDSRSESNSSTVSDDTSLVHGESIADTANASGSQSNSKYGFNSADATPVDEVTVANHEGKSTVHSGTDTTNRDVLSSETRTRQNELLSSETHGETESSEDTTSNYEVGADESEYTKHISGTDGGYMKQALIKAERELWNQSFFDKVYSDIDEVMTTLVYNRLRGGARFC